MRVPPGLIVLGLIASLGIGFTVLKNKPQRTQQSQPAIEQKTNKTTSDDFSGLLPYGGSTTFAAFRPHIDGYIRQNTKARPMYVHPAGVSPGSGSGIQQLIDGQVLLSQSSRPVSDAERQTAEAKGIKLEQIAVAYDAIAFAVNKQNPISDISLSDLRAIYTGQNRQFTVLTRGLEGGTVDFLMTELLKSDKIYYDTIVPTTTAGIRQLSTLPRGIFFASAPEIVNQKSVKVIPVDGVFPSSDNVQDGRYPITRSLFIVFDANNQKSKEAAELYADAIKINGHVLERKGLVPAQ